MSYFKVLLAVLLLLVGVPAFADYELEDSTGLIEWAVDGTYLTSDMRATVDFDTTGRVQIGTIAVSGTVSASAYYGDGSNLSGVSGGFENTADGDLDMAGFDITVIGSLVAGTLYGDGSNLSGVAAGWQGTATSDLDMAGYDITAIGTVDAASVTVDGTMDTIQLTVKGHSAQINSLIVAKQNDGTNVFTLSNAGAADFAGIVSATSFAADPAATPSTQYTDSDTTDQDVSASIAVNCSDTGSGTEDCDMTFNQQIAGVLTTIGTLDADGSFSIGKDIHAFSYYGDGSNLTGLVAGGDITAIGSCDSGACTDANIASLDLGDMDLSITGTFVVGTIYGNVAPKGYISGVYPMYTDSDTVHIQVGLGECNGNFFNVTGTIQHDMTSLAAGEDYHYIYVDDSASSYPTPTIIDATTEPTWSDSKLGFYNGNDRCVGAVWSPDASATVLSYMVNPELYFTYLGTNMKQVVTDQNPTGIWTKAEATADIPVNAIKVYVRVYDADIDAKCAVYASPSDAGPNFYEQVGMGSAGYCTQVAWLNLRRGSERDLYWWAEDDDDDASVDVHIRGYQLER